MKKYIDARRKDYLEIVKASGNQTQGPYQTAIDVKQTVTRITIEGEHTCMLVIRRIDAIQPGLGLQRDALRSESVELELLPIVNAPH